MIVLSIDTAATGGSVALLRDGSPVSESHREGARGQDAALPGMVDDVLAQAGLTLKDVDRFAVVTGPGSFTGARIGVAFVRGLALALGKPAIGVTSLMASLPRGHEKGLRLVLLPAQVRPPEKTWWGQCFFDGQVRSQPFEIGLPEIGATLYGFRSHVVAFPDPDLEAEYGAMVRPGMERAVRAGEFARHLSPQLFPPVPAYVRPPDAARPKASGA